MNDSRLASVIAALDDVVKDGVDLMDALPSTSPYVMPLRRAVRHAERDLHAFQAAAGIDERLTARAERLNLAGYGWKP